MRAHLLDHDTLVRAVASGRQKGPQPRVEAGRAALRRPQGRAPPPGHGVRRHPGAHRQPRRRPRQSRARRRWTTCSTSRSATGTSRRPRRPPGPGHQEARGGGAHAGPGEQVEVERGHDQDKDRLLPEDDPVLWRSASPTRPGRIKPSRQAKYRQVEEFLRLLDGSITDALARGTCVSRPPRTRCGSSTSAAATPT